MNGGAWAAIPGNAAFHLLAQTHTGKIVSDFAVPEQRRNEPISRIDDPIGANPTVRFAIDVGDGNIRIFKSYP